MRVRVFIVIILILLYPCFEAFLVQTSSKNREEFRVAKTYTVLPDIAMELHDVTRNVLATTLKYSSAQDSVRDDSYIELADDDYDYILAHDASLDREREAFHGLTIAGDWLVQAPQDHANIVCYNKVTGETKLIDVSFYTRAQSNPGNGGDKFNGAGTSHGGKYVWIAPSWTTHALKVNMETLSIEQTYNVNTVDDGYNGIIITSKYAWLVTHSQENLIRIDISDTSKTNYELSDNAVQTFTFGLKGDPKYNFDEVNQANNRSFFGGHDNGDGYIWLHPRSSKYLVKIRESDGTIVSEYQHELHSKAHGVGYFYGATRVGNKIYFAPFIEKVVHVFDISKEEWSQISLSGLVTEIIPSSNNYSFGSATDGRYVFFPPFKLNEIVVIDTYFDKAYALYAKKALLDYQAGSNGETLGFAGSTIVDREYVWFSSSFQGSYIKMRINDYGNIDAPPITNLISPTNNSTNIDSVVSLKWSRVKYADQYQIQVSNEAFFPLIYNLNIFTADTSLNFSQIKQGMKYFWRVKVINENGYSDWSEVRSFTTRLETGVEDLTRLSKYSFQQNYPNPFNPSTEISYSIPEPGHVSIHVINSAGQIVSTLVDKVQNAGSYTVIFDANGLASGVYLYRIKSGSFDMTKKMLLVK